MNEFIGEKKRVLTPQQQVVGVLGISLDELINAIRENRDGQYDHLFKPVPAEAAQG